MLVLKRAQLSAGHALGVLRLLRAFGPELEEEPEHANRSAGMSEACPRRGT